MTIKTDIAIIGGGTGGCAAALAACALGRRVIMTEPTAWIGHYNIDPHPSTGGDNYIDVAACKNIGTTHITNGCYRLHPVEWNIGEVAGALAAFCLERKTMPHAVRENDTLWQEFQKLLTKEGVELAWPESRLDKDQR
jgi:choline dehydrogenase-like flavoprotein